MRARTTAALATLVTMGTFAALAALAACASDCASSASTAPGAPNASSAPGAAAAGTSTPQASSAPSTSTSADAGPSGHVARYHEYKGVLHVHSIYSHDACDGHGLDAGGPGGINAECLAELRAAPCDVGLDFVNLTDHPAHMSEFDPVANLLFDATKGDQLVMGSDGTSPVGNLVTCPSGQRVLFTFGYEALHTLPLAFDKHPTRFEEYTSARPLADVQSLVADLKDAGALVALAHSEEADIDADRIVAGGADVMEWYNPHGNFKKTMGSDKVTGNPLNLITFFNGLSDFLAGSSSGANPDLAYLPLLKQWPVEGFDKWRAVQKGRFVPGVLGSDVHQNISIDPVCSGAAQVLCAAAAGPNASALTLLVTGGRLMMSDHQRLDSYDRIMRWLHNRLLTNDLSPKGVKEALAHGRSYGVFSVFGDPAGFYYEGTAAGAPLDMGDLAKGPVTLSVKLPDAPVPIVGGAPFDAAAAKNAVIRAVLFRTDDSGTTEVARSTKLGDLLTATVSEPGSYHVEVWVTPKHLLAALGPQAKLADSEYMWLITNPIRVSR